MQEAVAKVIELGANLEVTDQNGLTPLHLSSEHSDRLLILQRLIKSGANVHARIKSAYTPLMVASTCGVLGACIHLIKHRARIDDVSINGSDSLQMAIRGGAVGVMDYFIAKSPSMMELRNSFRCHPTHFAMHSKHFHMHLRALDLITDLDFDCNNDCGRFLHKACRHSRIAIFKVAMTRITSSKFQQICQKTSSVVSPLLILAVQGGDSKIISMLLEQGVDIDVSGLGWGNPVFVVCHYGYLDVLNFLFNHSPSAVCLRYDLILVSKEEAAADDQKLLD